MKRWSFQIFCSGCQGSKPETQLLENFCWHHVTSLSQSTVQWKSSIHRRLSYWIHKKTATVRNSACLRKGTLGGALDTDCTFILSASNQFVFFLRFAVSIYSQQITRHHLLDKLVPIGLTAKVNMLNTTYWEESFHTAAWGYLSHAHMARRICGTELWRSHSPSAKEPYFHGDFYRAVWRSTATDSDSQNCFNGDRFAIIQA